jgi:hypothetical protein
MDDALSLLWVGFEERFYGVRGEGEAAVDGGLRGFAWCGWVGQENAVLACELFECYGYEGSDTAYNEDLGVLVVVLARSGKLSKALEAAARQV